MQYLQDRLGLRSTYKGLHPRKTEITLCCVGHKEEEM
jgi:hypothetical protein